MPVYALYIGLAFGASVSVFRTKAEQPFVARLFSKADLPSHTDRPSHGLYLLSFGLLGLGWVLQRGE